MKCFSKSEDVGTYIHNNVVCMFQSHNIVLPVSVGVNTVLLTFFDDERIFPLNEIGLM